MNLQFVKGFLGDGVLFNELWENLGGKTWENVGMKEYVNWFFNYIHIVLDIISANVTTLYS